MIRVNGQVEPPAASVAELLVRHRVDPQRRGIAVAVNGAVVPRRQWESAALRDGDEVDIVKPLNGG